MEWLHAGRLRWRAFVKRRQLDRDLEDEIRFHLEMRESRNREAGMTSQEASHAARKQFGNVSGRKENIRAMWNAGMLETVTQDLRYAARTMRKNPVFVTTAVLTLALAIGGNTAMFTVIRAVLLNPLQYHDPDRLVSLAGGATPTRFADMQAGAGSVAEIGAHTSQENLTLSGGSEPEVLKGVHVSAGFLRILGVDPLRGRGFRPEEDSAGAPPVVMISTELWRRRFASDPQIIGRTVTLGAVPYTVIGVLPPRFEFPSPGIDAWMTAPSEWTAFAPKSRALSPFLNIFGRLKPGVSREQANAEMKVMRGRYAMAHPAMLDAKSKTPVEVTSMKDDLVANVRSMLWMLFGAVGFVLMIACANVANLLLTRAASREREFALRSALGAARSRLMGQLLVESVLLSVFGGVFGVLLAAFSLRAVPHIAALELPRVAEIHMDWVVVGFAAAVSIITGLLFGLAPSLGASRPDLMHALRASGEAAGKGASRRILGILNVRGLLSVAQVALSIVLLIGAALLIESVAYLRNVEVGFNPAKLLTVSVSLPPLRYDTNQKIASFFQQLTERVESLPGVRDAAVAMSLPMMGYAGSPVQDAAKPQLKLNERLIAKIFPVTPGYFRTLEIALKRGREFTAHDTQDAPRVAIIDENLARRFWPSYPAGLDPVGQHLLIGGVNLKPAEIVGIVSNVRQNLDNKKDWQETMYVSFAQTATLSAMVAIRVAGDPLSFSRAIREQVQMLDRNQPIGLVRTMEDQVEAQVGQRRLLVALLGSFALVALLLALIGIYGVIAYSVAQRIQEVGIRRALGAQQSDILRLILGQGVVLALTGTAVGLGGAVALTRVMRTLLFHVSATDPTTFIGIALLFFLVALGASYIPARRAARIDPITALRV
ncbi:MAG TPA: ABC transporter permease [Bryobacteraceae bacterium]|jgi:predicted permease